MGALRCAFAAILLGLAGACSSERVNAPTVLPAFEELRNAPEATTLEGVLVRLETYAWRDFQPLSPPDGKPLIVVLRIRSVGGTIIPSTLKADAIWVVNRDSAWAASVREEQARGPDLSFFEAVARDGPKWGPGVTVDIVVRLRDARGQRALVQARGQLIGRTD